ncbi:SART-1 family protein DOT2 [Linum grandiflorum]
MGGSQEQINETIKEEDGGVTNDLVTANEIFHEVPVGRGLSGALKLLHERGALKESIDCCDGGGGNMEKKSRKRSGIGDTNDDMDRFKDIRIERRDEFGRDMTPRQAFKAMSHAFHGKRPGKKKQEKRIKQYQEELKLKQMTQSVITPKKPRKD